MPDVALAKRKLSKRTHLYTLFSLPYSIFPFWNEKKEQRVRHFVKVESEADLDKVWPSNRYNGVPPKRKILLVFFYLKHV
jgi:hypothetical protein